jgi:hypothetical protein
MLEYFSYAIGVALGKEVVEALIYRLGANSDADFIVGAVWWVFHYKQARKRPVWYRILVLVVQQSSE